MPDGLAGTLLTDCRELMRLAVSAAQTAGEMLLEGFRDPSLLKVSSKSDGINNLVTEMDMAAEEMIRRVLSERGDVIFLGEESGGNFELIDPTWVVDPLDGTVNYAHGLPIWCVSIAVVQNNEPLVGVIYNPILDELFTAIKGGGAYRNDIPLHVSKIEEFRRSLLVTGFPYNINQNPHGAIDAFNEILHRGIAVRRLGSAALDLAYVAAGRFEGFWEVALNPWDVAAGILLVNEAGGMVSSYAKEETGHSRGATLEVVTDRMIATNGKVHEELLSVLRGGS